MVKNSSVFRAETRELSFLHSGGKCIYSAAQRTDCSAAAAGETRGGVAAAPWLWLLRFNIKAAESNSELGLVHWSREVTGDTGFILFFLSQAQVQELRG